MTKVMFVGVSFAASSLSLLFGDPLFTVRVIAMTTSSSLWSFFALWEGRSEERSLVAPLFTGVLLVSALLLVAGIVSMESLVRFVPVALLRECGSWRLIVASRAALE
jgi:hypothetical protein